MTNVRKIDNSTATIFLHAELMVDNKEINDLIVMKNDVNLQLLSHEIDFYGLFDFSILLIFKFISEIIHAYRKGPAESEKYPYE